MLQYISLYSLIEQSENISGYYSIERWGHDCKLYLYGMCIVSFVWCIHVNDYVAMYMAVQYSYSFKPADSRHS